jgi:hypothetical protein
MAYDQLTRPDGGSGHGFVIRFVPDEAEPQAIDLLDTMLPHE